MYKQSFRVSPALAKHLSSSNEMMNSVFCINRMLIHLLNTNSDPLILSVAAHDIGEYVRHYPRGKQ